MARRSRFAVSIFEDFNGQLALALRSDTPYLDVIDTSPVVGLILIRAFASKSYNFERLSISYMIDPQQLFNSCQLSFTRHTLQLLTLTSAILTQTAAQKEVFALLHNSNLAALNMPQLESMVLWNGKHGEACAFIYKRNKASRQAKLTWRGT
jgi:hypothetical protein